MNGPPVLIVDDNPANLKLARVLLEGEGYHVRTAADATEALDVLETFHPHLVLMDLQLPGMDGLELTRLLKSRSDTKDVLVLALTAYAMKGDEERARAAGCDAYVAKPIDTRTLPALVARLVGRPRQRSSGQRLAVAAPAAQTVLIVEDNPITRKMVRYALESEGYLVEEASDAAGALQLLTDVKPALVLQDLALPDLDGTELLSEIRRRPEGRDVPVLVLSGRTSKLEELRARGGLFDDFLMKPMEPSRLVEAVQRRLRAPVARVVEEGRPHVLVVDDDPMNRKLADVRLGHAGFKVSMAASATEALERARHSPPDVILSDILMPGTDGFQLCMTVREDPQLTGIPVVLVSASYLEEEDRQLASRMGASAFVRRTSDYREAADALLDVIAAAVPPPPPERSEELERTYRTRVLMQLEKQLLANRALTQRTAIHAATLSVIGGICEALVQPQNMGKVLGDILVHCLDATGLSTGLLYVLEPDGRLRLDAQCGLPASVISRASHAFGQSEFLKQAIERGTPMPLETSGKPEAVALQQELEQQSALVVPLVALGRRWGALVLASDSQSLAETSWLSFARALSAQLGQAAAMGQTLSMLATSEARYRSLFENAVEGIFQATGEGRFLNANPALARILGYLSPEELVTAGADAARHAVDQAWWDHVRAVVGDSGVLTGYEVPLKRRDGSIAWVRLNARAAGAKDAAVEGMVEDITERRRAQEAIKEREERLRHIVSSSPTVLFTMRVDGATPFLTWISPNAADVIGLAPEAALGSDWWLAHVHPEDHESVVTLRSQLLSAGAAVGEYRVERRDGSYVWVRDAMRLVTGAGGKRDEVVGSWTDITDQKKLEEDLRQAQKMEAVGRLAGGVAHDFNNLLTVINAHAELMLASLPPGTEEGAAPEEPAPLPPADVAEGLSEILKAGRRAAELTRQLLAFSRRQVLAPRLLDLRRIVSDLDSLLRRLIGEDIDMVSDAAEDIWSVRADPSQMEQIIVNLVVNARDAMPHGGKLTVETRNVSLDQPLSRPPFAVPPGRFVRLSVSDTGLGMDAATIAHIFEPFFTTKEQGKGTGLGLATVYGIVRQSGGHVAVRSEPGRGSTFEVYLPAVETGTGERETDDEEPEALRGSETVLLVEDEEALRRLSAIVLRTQGYNVLEADGPHTALRLATEHEGPIHALLTDVVMPDMSGPRLAQRLSGLRPGLRILFMSGYSDDMVLRREELGASGDLLEKPFRPSALVRAVWRTLRRA